MLFRAFFIPVLYGICCEETREEQSEGRCSRTHPCRRPAPLASQAPRPPAAPAPLNPKPSSRTTPSPDFTGHFLELRLPLKTDCIWV